MLDRTDYMQDNHQRVKPTFAKRGLGGDVRGDVRGDNRGDNRGDVPADILRGGRGSIRGRGSLLILVVTVLVIIALVGIAFLQRVRLDQAATARHERKFIDQVINGILADIGTQMTDDIFENANFGRELYDYPWTKDFKDVHAITINGAKVLVNGSGTPDAADPSLRVSGHEDDRWLASAAPVFNSNTYRWLHLTNLTGIWLDLEATGSITDPTEQPIDGLSGNIASSDTDILIRHTNPLTPTLSTTFNNTRAEPLGVDTDGDGVFDSRWQWVPVPVREFGGRKFVMAARIVDLNAMLNVNTATTLTAVGNLNDPEISGGYSPAWADLSRLASRSVNTAGNANPWRTELAGMLNFRINKVPRINTIPDAMDILLTVSELQTIWDEQASIYGNLDRNFLADTEVELRRFGGINDLSIESPLEKLMPRLLRQSPAPAQAEGSYADVVGVAGSVEAQISRWFYGADPGSPAEPDTDSVAVKDREFQALRHMLTTASGVGAYVSKYGGSATAAGIRKYDLRHETNGTLIDAQKLRERIEQAFKLPTSDPNQWYLGNKITLPETMDDLVNEYAMSIEDYADEDSIPGGFNRGELNGAGVSYGLERLPFLREAYMHVLYFDDDVDDGAGGPPDGVFDTWRAKDDTQAMVIELGNPFAHRIDTSKTDGIVNNIKIVVIQNGVEVSSWILDNTLPDIEARNDDGTDASDLLVLVSNQLGQSPADENGEGTGLDLAVDLNITTPNLVELADGQLEFNPGGGDVTIELQVDISGTGAGNWVVYDRMETGLILDEDIRHPQSATPGVAAAPQHGQASFWRNKENINYISIDTGNNNQVDLPDITSVSGIFKTASHQLLTDASASGGSWTMPAGFQLPLADQPIRSVAELGWIHMFGFTDTEPFSERVGRVGLAQPNRHFLLLDPADPDFVVLQSPPFGAGIPHAAVLMDLFTTVGTHEDGRDNDNDDGDDDPRTAATAQPGQTEASIDNLTEQFIPGMTNINTAPLHILTLGAPLAENIDDTEDLMRMILAYRDQPIKAAAGYPDDPRTPFNDTTGSPNIRTLMDSFTTTPSLVRTGKPGIATIGELMFLNPYGPAAPTNLLKRNMQYHGQDGTPVLPTEVDLYPDTDEAGTSSVSTGDDNEQRLARFQMLSQTLTTRSDRFAVYVVVRGYDGWEPGSGKPIEGRNGTGQLAEAARFIAIFDRGSMKDKNDSPRVIGFVRLQ